MIKNNTHITAIQPQDRVAGQKIQTLLQNRLIPYTTGVNATELFEFDTLLYNIYVTEPDTISEDTLTLVRLLAHSITEIDIRLEDLVHWKTYTPVITQKEIKNQKID